MTQKAIIPYDRALPEAPGRTPWTKPDIYLEKLGEGDYAVRQGRRPSSMFLVEKLRQAVDAWREAGYDGISPVTRRLFQYWFEEDHLLPDGGFCRYWWTQREAIETLVYLVEARSLADFKPLAEEFGEKPMFGMLKFKGKTLAELVTPAQAQGTLLKDYQEQNPNKR